MKQERFNEYTVMWVMVFFDLPTETKTDRKRATKFRQKLLNNGFGMFQFSIYIRVCPSRENANVYIRRIKQLLPPYGKVGILTITDKQFGNMEVYANTQVEKVKSPVQQLELF